MVKMVERVPHSCPQHGIAGQKNIPNMCAKLLPQRSACTVAKAAEDAPQCVGARVLSTGRGVEWSLLNLGHSITFSLMLSTGQPEKSLPSLDACFHPCCAVVET